MNAHVILNMDIIFGSVLMFCTKVGTFFETPCIWSHWCMKRAWLQLSETQCVWYVFSTTHAYVLYATEADATAAYKSAQTNPVRLDDRQLIVLRYRELPFTVMPGYLNVTYLVVSLQVAQLWQRDCAKLDTYSINIQRYSQNHAQNCIFVPPCGGIGGNICALCEIFNTKKPCSRFSSNVSFTRKTAN